MMLPTFQSAGLDGLKSGDQLKLLDTIDSLRSQGIHHYVSLPQIIVCGDQSAGKSSVLEAISGVSFPVKSSVCTRFPTELILRKSPYEGLEVHIIPHVSRSQSESDSLRKFNRKLEGFSGLPELIDAARSAMAVLTPEMSFSRDVLRIELHGPDLPHLTIVDLPGLIHSETKTQTARDVELIKEVVKNYMKQPRTIILAVVSAKYDYSNQLVLHLARKIDPKGNRTMGVITKPDTLLEGSESEGSFISLAKNQDIEFRLGWHVLKNADSETGPCTLEQRDNREAYFFTRGNWTSLERSWLGIGALRDRLSQVLLEQIASNLTEVVVEIQEKTDDCRKQLASMGRPRHSAEEQRIYLIQISQQFQTLVRAAAEGAYHDRFFGDAMTSTGFSKRLRALVQKLNIEFAQDISARGRQYRVCHSSQNEELEPGWVTQDELIETVNKLSERSRGRELPGLFNPMVIEDLFRKLCSPWEAIARAHVERVWRAAEIFMRHVSDTVADSSTSQELLEAAINPRLESIRENLYHGLDKLLKPHQEGHPITYSDIVPPEKLREAYLKQLDRDIEITIQEKMVPDSFDNPTFSVNTTVLRKDIMELIRSSPAHSNAIGIIDYVDGYYETALQRFIDNVSVEVIETALVAELAQVVSPMAIATMTTDQLAQIAGETKATRQFREDLQKKLRSLSQGLVTLQKHQRSEVIEETASIGTEEEESEETEADGENENTTEQFDSISDSNVESEPPNEPSVEVAGPHDVDYHALQLVTPEDGAMVMEDPHPLPKKMKKKDKKKEKKEKKNLKKKAALGLRASEETPAEDVPEDEATEEEATEEAPTDYRWAHSGWNS